MGPAIWPCMQSCMQSCTHAWLRWSFCLQGVAFAKSRAAWRPAWVWCRSSTLQRAAAVLGEEGGNATFHLLACVRGAGCKAGGRRSHIPALAPFNPCPRLAPDTQALPRTATTTTTAMGAGAAAPTAEIGFRVEGFPGGFPLVRVRLGRSRCAGGARKGAGGPAWRVLRCSLFPRWGWVGYKEGQEWEAAGSLPHRKGQPPVLEPCRFVGR